MPHGLTLATTYCYMVFHDTIYFFKLVLFLIFSSIHSYCKGGFDRILFYHDCTWFYDLDRLYKFAMNTLCEPELNIQVWSKEKLDWSQKTSGLNFPKYFSMLTGCAINIGNHQVLFIGGHHTVQIPLLNKVSYSVKMPVNNQVTKYDFKSNEWENITNIPIIEVSDIFIVDFTNVTYYKIFYLKDLNVPDIQYQCSLAFGKDGTRYLSIFRY